MADRDVQQSGDYITIEAIDAEVGAEISGGAVPVFMCWQEAGGFYRRRTARSRQSMCDLVYDVVVQLLSTTPGVALFAREDMV